MGHLLLNVPPILRDSAEALPQDEGSGPSKDTFLKDYIYTTILMRDITAVGLA